MKFETLGCTTDSSFSHITLIFLISLFLCKICVPYYLFAFSNAAFTELDMDIFCSLFIYFGVIDNFDYIIMYS